MLIMRQNLVSVITQSGASTLFRNSDFWTQNWIILSPKTFDSLQLTILKSNDKIHFHLEKAKKNLAYLILINNLYHLY